MSRKRTEILLVDFRNPSVLKSGFKQVFPARRMIRAKSITERTVKTRLDEVLTQSVYLLSGFKYEKLCSDVTGCGDRIITDEPTLSLGENVTALAGLLFQGYGSKPTPLTDHDIEYPLEGKIYAKSADRLRETGFVKIFVGMLEGRPGSDFVLEELRCSGASEIMPTLLIMVSGKHAREDVFEQGASNW